MRSNVKYYSISKISITIRLNIPINYYGLSGLRIRNSEFCTLKDSRYMIILGHLSIFRNLVVLNTDKLHHLIIITTGSDKSPFRRATIINSIRGRLQILYQNHSKAHQNNLFFFFSNPIW